MKGGKDPAITFLIILTAVTFMFLALGLEPIVDPRLKRRRSWHF